MVFKLITQFKTRWKTLLSVLSLTLTMEAKGFQPLYAAAIKVENLGLLVVEKLAHWFKSFL